MLDSGLERKVVTKSGSYFSFGDERLGQGRHNATAFLREHPDVTQEILQQIQVEVGSEQVVSARLLPVGAGDEAREEQRQGGGGGGGARGGRSRGVTPTVTALRERKRARVAVELDGREWRVLPADAVVRAGLAVGRPLDRPTARQLAREIRRARALVPGDANARCDRALARRARAAAGTSRACRAGAGRTCSRASAAPVSSTTPDSPRIAPACSPRRGYGDAAIRADLRRAPDRSRGRRRRGRRPRAGTDTRPRATRGQGDDPSAPAATRRARILTRHARCDRVAVCGRGLKADTIRTYPFDVLPAKAAFPKPHPMTDSTQIPTTRRLRAR